MFSKTINNIKAYFRTRETERILNGLSDAALTDIGLTRAGITEIAARRAPLPRRPASLATSFYGTSTIWKDAQPV